MKSKSFKSRSTRTLCSNKQIVDFLMLIYSERVKVFQEGSTYAIFLTFIIKLPITQKCCKNTINSNKRITIRHLLYNYLILFNHNLILLLQDAENIKKLINYLISGIDTNLQSTSALILITKNKTNRIFRKLKIKGEEIKDTRPSDKGGLIDFRRVQCFEAGMSLYIPQRG